MKKHDAVWCERTPGDVLSVNEDKALVRWDNGVRSIVSTTDLTPMTDFEARTSFAHSPEVQIHWDSLPDWLRESTQFRCDTQWTRSKAGPPGHQTHYSYWADGSFMAKWSEDEL